MDNQAQDLARKLIAEAVKITASLHRILDYLTSHAPRENKQQADKENKHFAEHGETVTVTTTQGAIGAQPAGPPMKRAASNHTEDKSERRWRRPLKDIGIVAGVAYAIVTFLQWHDIRNNFLLDERAWVGLQRVTPVEGQPIISVTGQNSGKTPALDVEIDVMRGTFPAGQFPDDPFYEKATTPVSHGAIFPGGPFEMRHLALPRNDFEAKGIKDGTLLMYLYGRIKYKDIFGKRHYTHFCWNIIQDPANQTSAVVGPKYNDTDDSNGQ